MKAEYLKLFELIKADEEEGALYLKNRRVLLIDADAVGVLRKELITFRLKMTDPDWTCADNYHLCIDTAFTLARAFESTNAGGVGRR